MKLSARTDAENSLLRVSAFRDFGYKGTIDMLEELILMGFVEIQGGMVVSVYEGFKVPMFWLDKNSPLESLQGHVASMYDEALSIVSEAENEQDQLAIEEELLKVAKKVLLCQESKASGFITGFCRHKKDITSVMPSLGFTPEQILFVAISGIRVYKSRHDYGVSGSMLDAWGDLSFIKKTIDYAMVYHNK